MQILVVDDDARSRNSLVRVLHTARYDVVSFESAPPALEYLSHHHVDAALIDYLLPGPNGLMLAERLRNMKPSCPIVLISHHAQIEDVERGYQVGIDDFVLRPVKAHVLLDRLAKALLRRAESASSSKPRNLHGLEFDSEQRIMRWCDKPLRLTPKETQLLRCLTSDPGQYFSYSDLYSMMYGERLTTGDACYRLRALLNRLRTKLEIDGIPRVIEGERGLGFRWNQSVLDNFVNSRTRPPSNTN